MHDVSMRATKDSQRRSIDYSPCAGRQFDVREAAVGCMHSGEWLGGMFDRGSWREYQRGWARTVVTGRARLEGLPVGVLGVESNAVTVSVPADPGMPTSSEQEIVQAGQVRAARRELISRRRLRCTFAWVALASGGPFHPSVIG